MKICRSILRRFLGSQLSFTPLNKTLPYKGHNHPAWAGCGGEFYRTCVRGCAETDWLKNNLKKGQNSCFLVLTPLWHYGNMYIDRQTTEGEQK